MLSGVHHPAHVTLHGRVGAVSGLPLPGRLKVTEINNMLRKPGTEFWGLYSIIKTILQVLYIAYTRGTTY